LYVILALLVAALAFIGTVIAATSQSHGRLLVEVGTNQTYTRTELPRGATVICRYHHHTLSVQAPSGDQGGSGAVWPKAGTTDSGLFHLNVNVAGDGYAVICGLGGHHSALVTR
jgi:hypothetical protein